MRYDGNNTEESHSGCTAQKTDQARVAAIHRVPGNISGLPKLRNDDSRFGRSSSGCLESQPYGRVLERRTPVERSTQFQMLRTLRCRWIEQHQVLTVSTSDSCDGHVHPGKSRLRRTGNLHLLEIVNQIRPATSQVANHHISAHPDGEYHGALLPAQRSIGDVPKYRGHIVLFPTPGHTICCAPAAKGGIQYVVHAIDGLILAVDKGKHAMSARRHAARGKRQDTPPRHGAT